MEDDLTSILNNRLPNNGKKAKPTAITLVKETDVLCGRGGLALRHPGNQNYSERDCSHLDYCRAFCGRASSDPVIVIAPPPPVPVVRKDYCFK